MKNMMKGFYNPTVHDLRLAWNSEQTRFVFDTNTLLNLYGYEEQTRNDFFAVLDNIKDRVWIPYHVALEYQRRRIGVIKDEKNVFTKVRDNLNKIKSIFSKDFGELHLERRIPLLGSSTDQLKFEIDELINKYEKSVDELDSRQPSINADDVIRERLDDIFNDRAGCSPSNQEWLDGVYTEGKERYAKKLPPGYKDSSKKLSGEPEFNYAGLNYQRQYGDLIIWKQLINYASDEDIKAIIFITDDSKEDWWQIENSRGEKIIGPKPELIEEIRTEAKIDLFMMYKTSDFLSDAAKNLKVHIDEKSVNDARNTYDWEELDDFTAINDKTLAAHLDSFAKVDAPLHTSIYTVVGGYENLEVFISFIKSFPGTVSISILSPKSNEVSFMSITDNLPRIAITVNVTSTLHGMDMRQMALLYGVTVV